MTSVKTKKPNKTKNTDVIPPRDDIRNIRNIRNIRKINNLSI